MHDNKMAIIIITITIITITIITIPQPAAAHEPPSNAQAILEDSAAGT
jgi:hypothetical protein